MRVSLGCWTVTIEQNSPPLPEVHRNLMLYPTPALQLQMTRQPDLLRRIWRCLNEIDPAALLGEGRVYGGGLHKLGPKELAKVSLAGITNVVPTLTVSTAEQLSLFKREVA